MSAHTPVPWTAEPEYEGENPTFVHKTGHAIADCNMGYGIEDDANAALIVRAVNRDHHFDALVKGLKEIVARTYSSDRRCRLGYESVAEICDIARQALDGLKTAEAPITRDVGGPCT